MPAAAVVACATMSLLAKLHALKERAVTHGPNLQTEEATKNALIMPFIQALGYDIFDPSEVVPEFTADIGIKKGEKVDYALKVNGEVVILVEAKKFGESLPGTHTGQLFRYFNVVKTARIGVLTNGTEYRLFSDLAEPNVMDDSPFLVVSLDKLNEGVVDELQGVQKDHFDLEKMLSAASDMKSLREIREVFEGQLENPDDEFARYFFSRTNSKARFVDSVRDQYRTLVKTALSQVVRDRVSSRLQSALAREAEPTAAAAPDEPKSAPAVEGSVDERADGIVTTDDELMGFAIVRAIAAQVVDLSRICARDTKSYFGVLLDDNNRKPICRLHFNRSSWYVGTFDADKNEIRHAIERLEDIYGLAAILRGTIQAYEAQSGAAANGDAARNGSPAPAE